MNSEKKSRAIVKQRSGGICELRIPEVCLGLAHSMHHRRKRSQGGPWSPSNMIHTCGDGTRGCHGLITNTRREYYDAGWIVHSWDRWDITPALVHTEQFGHDYVLLSDAGGVTRAPWPQQVEGHPDDLVIETELREMGGAA